MRILMATMGLDIGGAETHIVELAKELKSQGHDVIIISNGGVYVPEVAAAGIRHYQAPLHQRSLLAMSRAWKILRRVIRLERPDIVHAHARIPAFLCGALCRKMKLPFVTTAHWVFDTSGALRYLTDWGERTVAVSDDIKAYLIREYGLPAEHISVTINGIDTEKFSPGVSGERVVREFGLDQSKPILSYVSRMDEDRALVAGQLIELGKVEEVFYDPRHPYTWALLSSLPQLAQQDTQLYSITGTPPSLYKEIVGDAFAPRNPYCMKIDTLLEPPMFQVTDTHYAKTWLLDPDAPKIEKPEGIKDIHEKLLKAFNI